MGNQIMVGFGEGSFDCKEIKKYKAFSKEIITPYGEELVPNNSIYCNPVQHCYFLKKHTKTVYLGFCVNNYSSINNGLATFRLARVQTYDYLYNKGIATIMLCHKILRLMEIYDDTFMIDIEITDDAKDLWNGGKPLSDGTPPVYVYRKIFQHDKPTKKCKEAEWTDERVYNIKNREADIKYYKDLYESKVANLVI